MASMPASFDSHGIDQALLDSLMRSLPAQPQKMKEFSLSDLAFDHHHVQNPPTFTTALHQHQHQHHQQYQHQHHPFVPCVPELDLPQTHPLPSPGILEVPNTPSASPRGSLDGQHMFNLHNLTGAEFEKAALSRACTVSPTSPASPASPSFTFDHSGTGLFAQQQHPQQPASNTRPQSRKVRLEGSIRRRYETLMKEGPPCDRKPAATSTTGKKTASGGKAKKRKGSSEEEDKQQQGQQQQCQRPRLQRQPSDLESEEELAVAEPAAEGEEGEEEAERLEKNRQSARDCRLRKKYYIKGLESKVEEFQDREEQHLAALEDARRQVNEWRARHDILLQQCRQYGMMHG